MIIKIARRKKTKAGDKNRTRDFVCLFIFVNKKTIMAATMEHRSDVLDAVVNKGYRGLVLGAARRCGKTNFLEECALNVAISSIIPQSICVIRSIELVKPTFERMLWATHNYGKVIDSLNVDACRTIVMPNLTTITVTVFNNQAMYNQFDLILLDDADLISNGTENVTEFLMKQKNIPLSSMVATTLGSTAEYTGKFIVQKLIV
jgi:hypothetical protein